MACTFHHLLFFLFHEKQDILYINSLLFTEWNLTAMINEVNPPCFGAGGDGLHFPVVKSFLLQELRKCVYVIRIRVGILELFIGAVPFFHAMSLELHQSIVF